MATAALVPDQLAHAWRRTASDDNPAGPLFTGGRWAEADLLDLGLVETRQFPSLCTGSRTIPCC